MNDLDLTYDDIMLIRVALHNLINECKAKANMSDEEYHISTEDRLRLSQIADRAQTVYEKFDRDTEKKGTD